MADAGKIMIVPKGAYDASVSYEILDLVTHNDIVWVAKKDVTGVEPSDANAEYWFKMVDDNVSKLGGKSASEYALVSQLFARQKNYHGLDFDTITESGVYSNVASPAESGCANYPTNVIGVLIVFYHDSVPYQIYSDYMGNTWVRAKFASYAWEEWKQLATTADLANYLPLSGGRLQGGYTPLIVNNTSATGGTVIGFQDGGVSKGFLGIQGNIPIFLTTEGAYNTLLHTGNKPSGSYTGNGSATQRTINTGALWSGYGGACIVYCTNGVAIVTHRQAVVISLSGSVTYLPKEQAQYISSNIILNTDNAVLNGNGETMTYIVI